MHRRALSSICRISLIYMLATSVLWLTDPGMIAKGTSIVQLGAQENTTSTNTTVILPALALIVLASNTTVGTTQTKLFKITNLNYSTQQSWNINGSVCYAAVGKLPEQRTYAGCFSFTGMKKEKSANTGNITWLTNGTYTLCGWFQNATARMPPMTCANLTITGTYTCNKSIGIQVMADTVASGEKIMYTFTGNHATEPVTHWITQGIDQNLMVKMPSTSTGTSTYSYTPPLSEYAQQFTIHASISPSCPDTYTADNQAIIPVTVAASELRLSSFLELQDTPTGATGGDVIMVKLKAYRGDTAKSTIYLDVRKPGTIASQTSKMTVDQRFAEEEFAQELELKDACDIPAGDYVIQARGLGVVAEKKIAIVRDCPEDAKSTTQETTKSTGTASFTLTLPESLYAGEPFDAQIDAQNPTENFIGLRAYSYAYKGSISYSGDREQNAKELHIAEFSNSTFFLTTSVSEPGTMSYKVRIFKDDRKTPIELIQQITILSRIGQGENGTQEHESPYAEMNSSEQATKHAQDTLIVASPKLPVQPARDLIIGSGHTGIKLVPFLFLIALALLLLTIIWLR